MIRELYPTINFYINPDGTSTGTLQTDVSQSQMKAALINLTVVILFCYTCILLEV